MQINFDNNKINYTGMGARQLKGIFLTSDYGGVASEICNLASKTGLKVYSLDKDSNVVSRGFQTKEKPALTWAQDIFSFVGNKLLIDTELNPEVKRIEQIAQKLVDYFHLKYEPHSYHMQGGNYIFNITENSKDLFIGKYDRVYLNENEIANRFGADNVYVIPQVAAHLDAFMFVDGKRAFVCDDNMMLSALKKGINNLEKMINSSSYGDSQILKLYLNLVKIFKSFELISKNTPYAPSQQAIDALNKAGYEIVKIPGRLYHFTISNNQIQHIYGTNFANAIVHKNNSGDTILLTNESANDLYLGLNKEMETKINFSFKKMFLDAIVPYIKRENVHFIKGNNNAVLNLLSNLGGIHCSSAEII